MDESQIAQYIIDSVGTGSIYALIALSLALLFGIMGLMNFAYGELIMVGGYTMVALRDQPVPVLVLGVIGATVCLSIAMERLAFRPVRHASAVTLLVTSFAVSVMTQRVAAMLTGPTTQGVRPWSALTSPFVVGDLRISRLDVLTAGVTVILLATLVFLLKKTLLGIQLRAATEDFTMARLLGVRANLVIAAAFGITGVLAGVVAILFFARYGAVSPTVGLDPVLIAFVGGVVGGLGSLVGATVGGFALGAVTVGLESGLPSNLASYTEAFAFGAVIVILLVAPRGIVGLIPARGMSEK